MTALHFEDPIAQQAAQDYGHAMQIAQHYWPQASDEDVRTAAASVLIYIQNERDPRRASHPAPVIPRMPAPASQAGQARGAASPRPAPASAPSGELPRCPKCGGEVYDNRESKKSPKHPDFRCKDKNCKNEAGFITAFWAEKKKTENTPYAQQHERGRSESPTRESYERNPLGAEGDDDLPF